MKIPFAVGVIWWLMLVPLAEAGEPSSEERSPLDLETLVAQPIQEYFYEKVPYTHLGSDFGPIGPPEQFEWRDSRVIVRSDGLAGMWHGLAGLTSEKTRSLDFSACFPNLIRARFQPSVRGVYIVCQLRGVCQIEIKDAENRVLWRKQFSGQDPAAKVRSFAVPTDTIQNAKFLNWTISRAAMAVHRFGLLLEPPPRTSAQTLAFVYSYAKLARCYDAEQGLVRDKAFSLPGQFDCLPTSGMFCLSTAVAAKVSVVDPQAAIAILHRVHKRVGEVTRAAGILPHFVTGVDPPTIVPGSEFSTVDTSLYYHGMILAAHLLGETAVLEELESEVHEIDFARLTSSQGYISHGLADDGKMLLESNWEDWGGETGLVMMLRGMAPHPPSFPSTRSPGKVHQDVGFISEIQSLFYPQFSMDRLDFEGVNWLRARQAMLTRHQAYFGPDVPSSKLGVYGLSAGESAEGDHYVANGAEIKHLDVIHPHYLLMSACIRKRPKATYETLEEMSKIGMFPPWGLAENVSPGLNRYLAYNGSLNASFECLAAYHLAALTAKRDDLIYRAAITCPATRRAISVFFP